jgi:hypothetical protein
MRNSDWAKILLALAALAGAGYLWFWRADHGGTDQAFFYDLSEKRLFAAPRTSVPPIRGLNGSEPDAVRAVVISTNGQPERKETWKIAYLEKYSPELKRQMEEAQRSGGSPALGRDEAMSHRFVRRLEEAEWYAMNTPEAEKIVTEWSTPGPDGVTPTVCSP